MSKTDTKTKSQTSHSLMEVSGHARPLEGSWEGDGVSGVAAAENGLLCPEAKGWPGIPGRKGAVSPRPRWIHRRQAFPTRTNTILSLRPFPYCPLRGAEGKLRTGGPGQPQSQARSSLRPVRHPSGPSRLCHLSDHMPCPVPRQASTALPPQARPRAQRCFSKPEDSGIKDCLRNESSLQRPADGETSPMPGDEEMEIWRG
ncbi:uncharacterized protein LOC111179879 [Delphinapterus leucas]|uniref:Uncharacterized protein LOC111179879 n=1 Tax=Delphinapterus leucas TaxID=9749 RepID=A0A7F8K394_DELLE|nr:uncharacterized protein LOC111179879 [Delphinapterus leucas]